MTGELKPCPFCTSKRTAIGYNGQPAVTIFAMCQDCGATGPTQQYSGGMSFDWGAAWNFRATLAPSDQADGGKSEAVAVVGPDFQLLYCRKNWSDGLKVGTKLYAAPPAGCAPRDERITKPAQVAGAVFRAGVAVETVIKAAQRNYQYRNDPAVQDYPDRFTLEQIQAMDNIIPQGDREFVSAKDYEALARELAVAKEKS